MWEALRGDAWWQVVEVEDVPVDGAFSHLLRKAQDSGYLIAEWSTRIMPTLSIPKSGADPLSNCPVNFKTLRSRLKGKLTRLHQEDKVIFQVHTERCEEHLKRFLQLEASGWKQAQGSAIACSAVVTRFYGEIFKALEERGMARFYSMQVGEKTVAMHLGIASRGAYYAPKVAYDECFSRFSPGQLLNRYVIEDLCEQGFHTYDFLGPRAMWKAVWTSRVRPHNNYYIFRPTIKGRALHALVAHGAARLRKLRHRLYGDPQAIPG
jgi:hypothetical protein